jgi:hypothetical protein
MLPDGEIGKINPIGCGEVRVGITSLLTGEHKVFILDQHADTHYGEDNKEQPPDALGPLFLEKFEFEVYVIDYGLWIWCLPDKVE